MGLGRQEVIKEALTFTAGGAIVANTFVKLDSNGAVVQAGAGDEVKGVAMHAADSGSYVEVALINAGNVVRVASGAAVTRGSKVASDANGKAIDAAAGDIEVGQADEGSGALNVYAIVHLTRGGTVISSVTAVKTGAYTTLKTDRLVLVDSSGGVITITLAPAADMTGKHQAVKMVGTGTNAVTLDGNASETIDGSTTDANLDAQYDVTDMMSDGSNWHIMSTIRN